MLEDEKQRATEQAKMLEMDLEVHSATGVHNACKRGLRAPFTYIINS